MTREELEKKMENIENLTEREVSEIVDELFKGLHETAERLEDANRKALIKIEECKEKLKEAEKLIDELEW